MPTCASQSESRAGPLARLLRWRRGSDLRARTGAACDCSRTISAAPHPRAARPLWSERGRRGPVSDLGGGGQPTAQASAASASRSPLARTRNVANAIAQPDRTDRRKRSCSAADAHSRSVQSASSRRIDSQPFSRPNSRQHVLLPVRIARLVPASAKRGPRAVGRSHRGLGHASPRWWRTCTPASPACLRSWPCPQSAW